jgi:hypothetical protein
MLHQILGMETEENRKLKEYEIVEILERVCNKEMDEYGWEPPISPETTLLSLFSPLRDPSPVRSRLVLTWRLFLSRFARALTPI